MSNSRVEPLALALLLLAGCATTAAVAPEAPREGARVAPERVTAPVTRDERVEVESAVVLRASEQPDLLRRIGNTRGDAGDLLLIDVRTAQPLGDLARGAAPAIVLDGTPLESHALDQRRLVAVVPARSLRTGEHAITVTWLGAEATTTSRRAYVLRVP